jgi:hypothetical protein
MTRPDPLFEYLSELPVEALDPELSRKIRVAALQALRPRPVHPMWTLAAAASVVSYLGWALHFASTLY